MADMERKLTKKGQMHAAVTDFTAKVTETIKEANSEGTSGQDEFCRQPTTTSEWPKELEYRPTPISNLHLGFVILVHKCVENAIRLMARLQDMARRQSHFSLAFVIHVDDRRRNVLAEIKHWAEDLEDIEIFHAHNVSRGGFAMLLAALDGFARLHTRHDVDFAFLLSESHYPIRSAGQFHAMLSLHQGMSFIGTHYWLRKGGNLRPRKGGALGFNAFFGKPRVPAFQCGTEVFLIPNVTIPQSLLDRPYVSGVQWVMVAKRLLHVVAHSGKIAQDMLEAVALFAQPDESYFQTLIAGIEEADPCDPLATGILGYPLTWNERAQDIGPDPDSEVEVNSPPLLGHLAPPDSEAKMKRVWATPALFARKFDNGEVTKSLQDFLDESLNSVPSWKEDHNLEPLCLLYRLRHPFSLNPACVTDRQEREILKASEPYPRLIIRFRAPSGTSKEQEYTLYAVERWVMRQPGQYRFGLHVLTLRVGRSKEKADWHSMSLWQASVLWPGEGTVGLLAHLEVLPMNVGFDVEWRGPRGNLINGHVDGESRRSYVWSPFPQQENLLVPGKWSVSLWLGDTAPGGPMLLAWRQFLVLDSVLDSSGVSNKQIAEYFDLSMDPPVP
eukprot:gnl/MRDRNA2_/MRDRNA2_176500_c0_seq1.p1 gnl/MRDRNA2_/MRDRNA2_176500_c0~~gnl/MRDRNA2_/MRDRNA2_176500_c0_seq1.p1  ORF type:complete len:702 (+),score=111.26 gnl/MRDRNA2_/MRDRNA2_176500_c0_seq1:270-2108(+)